MSSRQARLFCTCAGLSFSHATILLDVVLRLIWHHLKLYICIIAVDLRMHTLVTFSHVAELPVHCCAHASAQCGARKTRYAFAFTSAKSGASESLRHYVDSMAGSSRVSPNQPLRRRLCC